MLCFVIDVLKGFVIDAINHRISDCYHRINKKFQIKVGKYFLEKDQIFSERAINIKSELVSTIEIDDRR